MTLGQLRLQIQKQYPGTDIELISNWISSRHRSIIEALPWQREGARGVLTLEAAYATGTVSVTNGSSAITGSGTGWDSSLDKRVFRVDGSNERYEFTYTGATAGTLDRPFAGVTAAGLAYNLYRTVYSLPSDLLTLTTMALQEPPGPIDVVDVAFIDQMDPARQSTGQPRYAAIFMDSQTAPPLHQVEFWPWPDAAFSVDFGYEYEPDAPTGAGVAFLPWIRTDALEAGVGADILRNQKDWTGAREMEAVFQARLAEMRQAECFRRNSGRMQKADWITRRNWDRAIGGDVAPRGSWRW